MDGVRHPDVSEHIHYFPNGGDPEAASNGARYIPGIVIQHFPGEAPLLNIRLFPDAEGPLPCRRNVKHKSVAGDKEPYWDHIKNNEQWQRN